MDGASTRIAAATRSGVGFAAEAWRDAWAPLSLVAIGQATALISAHLDLSNAVAGRLQLCGWVLSGLAMIPAVGALYRSAVGGPALRDIGWGGFQVRAVEGRLVGAALGLGLAGAALAAVLLLAGGAVWYPLRNMGVVRVPLIGPFGLWFLAAAPVLLIVGWMALIGWSGLALILPALAGERRLQLGRVLRGSRRWRGSLAASTLLLEIAPLIALVAVVQSLAWLERGQAGGMAGAVWPTPDAIAAGGILATFYAFLLLPLGVGARTYFYGRVLAEDRARQRRHAPLEPAVQSQSVLRLVHVKPDASLPDADADAEADAEAQRKSAQSEVAAETITETAGDSSAAGAAEEIPAAFDADDISTQPAGAEEAKVAVAAPRWVPPVAPLRAAGLAQAVTTPILLAHANDRDLPPPWWMPPEHPEGPPVA